MVKPRNRTSMYWELFCVYLYFDLVTLLIDHSQHRHIITQWNANRLDLFELSMPNEVCMQYRYHSSETIYSC